MRRRDKLCLFASALTAPGGRGSKDVEFALVHLWSRDHRERLELVLSHNVLILGWLFYPLDYQIVHGGFVRFELQSKLLGKVGED